MIKRVCYALRMSWLYRSALGNYVNNKKLQTPRLLALDPKQLKAEGIAVLGIDFDGVLASHGEESLAPEVGEWLKDALGVFGKTSIFILTNKPTETRLTLFQQFGIDCIQGVRKKPYPDGIIQILERTQMPAQSVLLLDDRLLTGILAAELAGIKARWVTEPYINLKKRPFSELFFMGLRKLEYWLLC